MTKKGKTTAIILLSIGICLSLLGACYGLVMAFGKSDDVKLRISDQVVLQEDGSVVVQSEEEALEYFVDNSDKFGIDEPYDSLYFERMDTLTGDLYYNIRQQYQGIPVYGNRFVLMTDKDGTVQMSSGVYKPIDESMDMTPSVSESTIADCFSSYMKEIEEKDITDVSVVNGLSDDKLVIYSKKDDEGNKTSVLAYELDLSYEEGEYRGSYHLVADAHSGEVLTAYDNIMRESETIRALGVNDNNKETIDNFDFDIAMAESYVTPDSPANRLINSMKSFTYPSQIIVNELDKKEFQKKLNKWRVRHAITSPSEYVEGKEDEKTYCAAALFSIFLKEESDDNYVYDIVRNAESEAGTILKNIQGVSENKKVVDDLLKKKKSWISIVKSDSKLVDDIKDEFQKNHSKLSNSADIFDNVDKVFSITDDLVEGLKTLSMYIQLSEIAANKKAIIRNMYELCPDDSILKGVLSEASSAMEGYAQAINEAAINGTASFGRNNVKALMDEGYGTVLAKIPCVSAFMAGAGVGTHLSDIFCNNVLGTEKTFEQYLKMKYLGEINTLLNSTVDLFEQKYTADKSSENASNYIEAVYTMFTVASLSCDYADNFSDIINKEAWLGKLISKFKKNDDYYATINNIRNDYAAIRETLLSSYWTDLQDKYPDVFEVSEMINVYKSSDNQYYMYDEERNIAVYNSNCNQAHAKWGVTSVPVVWNNAREEAFEENAPDYVTSESGIIWDADAVSMMHSLKESYDWYQKMGLNGFNKNNGLVIAYYNDGVDSGNNAYSNYYMGDSYTHLACGFNIGTDNIDIIAHEYAHSVQAAIKTMAYSNDSGAIMEAYADTMGEIIEGDDEWCNSIGRNIAEPEKSGNPARLYDSYYQNPGSDHSDNGGIHQNSTILSHASYLMYRGIEGESIGKEQIAQLWLETFEMLPDIDALSFDEFGYMMAYVGKTMAKDKEISSSQYLCIYNALSAVGIVTERMVTIVDSYENLYLNDFFGRPLDNAEVEVYQIHEKYQKDPDDDTTIEFNKNTKVCTGTTDEEGHIYLALEDASFYEIRVRDTDYPEYGEQSFYLFCEDNCGFENLYKNLNFRYDIVSDFSFGEEEYNIAINEGKYIDAIIEPEGISERYYDITWSSSDDGVVKVDKHTGRMTGITEGSAVISAKLTNKDQTYEASATVNVTKKQRDTVLVLDCSGSMEGTAMDEMKKSAINFCRTLLNGGDNWIEIIGYDNYTYSSGFIDNIYELEEYINNLRCGNMTNMYAAMQLADDELQSYGRINSVKNIVIMSDGAPNYEDYTDYGTMTDWCNANSYSIDDDNWDLAPYGNLVCEYSDYLREDYNVYSLGFFHSLDQDIKGYCSYLMQYIQNSGYYEVTSAENLQFTFDDISDEVRNGSKIVIHIACPVEVSVTYGDETLSSNYSGYNGVASFGTLERAGADGSVKILELDSDKEYSIRMNGTGNGTMDYSTAYYNDKDELIDSRVFNSVPITPNTLITAGTAQSVATTLDIDGDGDGKVDAVWTAESNAVGSKTWQSDKTSQSNDAEYTDDVSADEENASYNVVWISIVIICVLLLITFVVILIIVLVKKEKTAEHAANVTANDNPDVIQSMSVQERPEEISTGIQILDGSLKGSIINFGNSKGVHIGKDSRLANVVVDSQFTGVSRLHCTVVYSADYGKYIVTDNSTNGTYYINSRQRLEKGSRVAVDRGTILYLANESYRIRLL